LDEKGEIMKKTIRPYISTDLETTGVATDKVHILELGAVLDDGVNSIDNLKTFNVLIKEPLQYTEEYAMNLNTDILQQIDSGKSGLPIMTPGEAFVAFAEFVQDGCGLALEWDQANGVERPSASISFAGKNISTFDFPIIHTALRRMTTQTKEVRGIDASVLMEVIANFTVGAKGGLLKRRFIDLGSVYFDQFGYIPSQDEIMNLLGWEKVNHRAKDDAMQVVKGLRAKWETNPSL
jgi:hypothetical protein